MRSGIGLVAGVLAVGLAACAKEQPKVAAAPPAGPAKGTTEWKIQNAMSAAPMVIASAAAVLDLPGSDGKMAQLKAGTNGWTCVPDDPNTPANDPTCTDAGFMDWFGAWMQHKPPHLTMPVIAYMLQGASDASNTDPFKMKPDSGQPWVITGPHIMVAVPDPRSLSKFSTDWKSGGPYVMFAGTPYAHLMIPVAAAKADSGTGMQM
jgi:hypothetical protein